MMEMEEYATQMSANSSEKETTPMPFISEKETTMPPPQQPYSTAEQDRKSNARRGFMGNLGAMLSGKTVDQLAEERERKAAYARELGTNYLRPRTDIFAAAQQEEVRKRKELEKKKQEEAEQRAIISHYIAFLIPIIG